MIASRNMLVRCRACEKVWSLSVLPVPLHEAANIARHATCPRCEADAKQIVMANAADADAWEIEQQGLARK